jgi:hypothetical protein
MAEPILPPNMAAFLQQALAPDRNRNLSMASALRSSLLNAGPNEGGESVMGPMPQMPPTLSGVENMGVEQRLHHSNYQPRDTGRFVAGKPEWPKNEPEGPPRLRTEPGPPLTQGQNMALEMTGVPSAWRGSQTLASADSPMDVVRGVGQVAAAGPGRGGLAGFLMSEAAAQTPDPRQKRMDEIDKAIKARERVIQSYANRQFPTRQGRIDATKIEQDAIDRLSTERTTLQGQINEEIKAENDRRMASERGAQWAKKPFQQRYPGALEAGVGTAATIGGVVPFLASRGRVRNFQNEIARLDNDIMAAVARANNTTLRQGQTHAALGRERTQAANDARALQAQRDELAQQGAGSGGIGHHLGAGAAGGGFTELPMAGALVHDYLAGRSDPSGELYNNTIDQVNVIDHPGSVLGRYAIPFGLGFAAGGVGDYLGSLGGGNVPAGHSGQVSTLKKRYSAPRKR